MTRMTRRAFMGTGAGAAALTLNRPLAAVPGALPADRPNILLMISDQLSWSALGANGCPWVRTPNIDRLAANGVSFALSHSTNPVCSPARSSILTGRMPVETGVIVNDLPIHPSIPNLGQWLGARGYDPVYCGKWHLPGGRPHRIPGFRVLPAGAGQGDLMDNAVSRLSASFVASHKGRRPFFLVSSMLQPHDICYWAIRHRELVPAEIPFSELRGPLPDLPPNLRSRPAAPAVLDAIRGPDFSDDQWRYYRYIYFRQVEMLDAEIGRILDALEHSGQASNTIVILTSDHGEGGGHHSHVQKWYPYEESVRVPLVLSCPGRVNSGVVDRSHLVSGLDITSTVCDYAGLPAPPSALGLSLRPLAEGKPTEWREFVASEHHRVGRMVRSARYKYVRYRDDPVEQLFDMGKDPWEMNNLYRDAAYAEALGSHRGMLDEWTASLAPAPAAASSGG